MKDGDRRAAIVCCHVLEDGLPILRMKRDPLDPEDPADSGWQFLCDSGAPEGMDTIRVVAIQEVLGSDLSIEGLIDSACGSSFIRLNPSEPWTLELSPQ